MENYNQQPEQQNENTKETRIMPESSLGVFKGGNFYFDLNGQQLRVWFSSFSGKEQIYLNEELISTNRSWRKMSTHEFHFAGEFYRVRLGVRSWGEAFRGVYVSELYRGEQLIDQDEIVLFQDEETKEPFSWTKFTIGLVPWLIGGFIVGFLTSKLAFSLFS